MRVTETSIACAESAAGNAAYENAYYIHRSDPVLLRVRTFEIRSDIYDHCGISLSHDNGRSWAADTSFPVSFPTEKGMVRRDYGLPVVEPRTGRLYVLSTVSLHPRDHMLDALTHTYPLYRMSEDRGKSWRFEERIIQKPGRERYTEGHPIHSVWAGKNAVHFSNMPYFSPASGKLVVTVQITRLMPDGSLFCPPGALSFHETMLLFGTPRDDGKMEWELSDKITLEPDRSTRGTCEGALAGLEDGRMLIVMRGSNSGNTKLPGRKWHSYSGDGGRSWGPITPWGYSDGSLFYSPSSYSTILRHSNGSYYWFGNISPENPDGNLPRHPLVVGRIDPVKGLLEKDTVTVVDTQKPDDEYPPLLGNFSVHEDRENGEMVLRMTRLYKDAEQRYRGPAYLYRIEP